MRQLHWSQREYPLQPYNRATFYKYGKDSSVVVVVTDSHVLRGSTLRRSELRQRHIATFDVCSSGRATFCHNRNTAQKPL